MHIEDGDAPPPGHRMTGAATAVTDDDAPAQDEKPAAPPTIGPPILSSRDLLAGHREVIIQHGKEQYRLRLTNSNKLILVK